MANLGICRRCRHCQDLHRAVLDDCDRKISASKVSCGISVPYIGWDSEVPEGCPYKLEHIVSGDAVTDLAEESSRLENRNEAKLLPA